MHACVTEIHELYEKMKTKTQNKTKNERDCKVQGNEGLVQISLK